jgi:hypothetical protein
MGGRSSNQQSTAQTDNRRVIGERGVSAENSTVTINALDAEVMNQMFGFAGQQSRQVFDFGGQALDTANESMLAALGFGGKALDAALDASADALAFADANSTRNTLASYNFASDALGGSFSFGTNALNKAFQAADGATALVKDAYADAKGRGALTDKILMGAIAAMAVVALMAVKK